MSAGLSDAVLGCANRKNTNEGQEAFPMVHSPPVIIQGARGRLFPGGSSPGRYPAWVNWE